MVQGLPRLQLAVTREHLRREEFSSDLDECIVCLASPRRVAFGCGHLCVCDDCSHTVDFCPVCRLEIRDRRRIFSP
ncbi:hypothetical protein M885DRAFT_505474 [Pelagophyceae sp. CCMP2097]|nr:hypothetical protein M885DRAFT_505474 [Pelagophyceae sp. CCMP2097]